MFLTAPRSCWRRARSTFENVLKASVAASCAYRMDAASGRIAPAGMTDVAPGLRGGKTLVVERVAYTMGERVRHKWPRVPQTRLVETDAALEFRILCITCSVVYVGSLLIGGM